MMTYGVIFRRVLVLAGLATAVGISRAQVPVITDVSAPRQVVARGQSLTLSVTATGATSYQWKRSGRTIAGATGNSYTIADAQMWRDAGWYQAVVSNSSGAAVSATVFVIVAPPVTEVVAVGNGPYRPLVPAGLDNAIAICAGWMGASYAVKADGTVVTLSGNPPPALTSVVRVASNNGGLALRADGTVVSWGMASPPSGLTGIVDIAVGYDHSVALKSDGTVVAWGSNANGQTNVPFGLNNVVAITAGYSTSQALKADGTVVAWGNDVLGGGVAVLNGLSGVVALAATHRMAVAVNADGTALAFPGGPISGIANAVAAAAGETQILILRSDATVAALGQNTSGELDLPPNLSSAFAVAAGGSYASLFSLVLRDASGDLPPTITSQPHSGTVFDGQEVALRVAASAGTALLRYQWRKSGTNIAGATDSMLWIPRFGAADAGTYDVVVASRPGSVTSEPATLTFNTAAGVVTNITGQQTLAPGQSVTLEANAGITGPVSYQWRRNAETIAGATNATYRIAAATWRDVGAYQVVVTNALGRVRSAPIFVKLPTASQVRAWGVGTDGATAVPAGLNDAVAVAAGGTHSVALRADGTIVAWGGNSVRQASVPAGLSGVVAIAAGGDSTLALLADGSLVPWGRVNYLPAALTGVPVEAISVGASSNMALRGDGKIIVWTSSRVRTDVPRNLENVVSIAAGGRLWTEYTSDTNFTFAAVDANGAIVSWGPFASSLPSGIINVKEVALGVLHAAALKQDGTVLAWGSEYGGRTIVPPGLAGVVAIAASDNGSIALKGSGTVTTWGFAYGGSIEPPPDLMAVLGIAGGANHALAVRDASADGLPVITTQPVSVVANEGTPASFTVAATAVPPVTSYRWRNNGTNIGGATTASLSFTSVQSSTAGIYDVVVTNAVGSVTSSGATLTVHTLPVISSQPQDQTVLVGADVTLSVNATGLPTPIYRWRKNGADITGATTPSLALNNVQVGDAGNYSAVVTNSVGSVTSRVARLTVQAAPGFSQQPADVAALGGSTVNFTVAVSGAPAPTLQWQRRAAGTADFLNVFEFGQYSGVTTPTLRVSNITAAMRGDQFRCVAWNGISPNAVSAAATLLVNQPPWITSADSAVFFVNVAKSFTFAATGLPAPTFSVSAGALPSWATLNATTGVLSGTPPNASGTPFVFTITATNGVPPNATQSFTLHVPPPPVITAQPGNQIAVTSGSARFAVAATGTGSRFYSWYFTPAGGTAPQPMSDVPGRFSGTSSPILRLSNVQSSDAGDYVCVVTDELGSTTSNAAQLSIFDRLFNIANQMASAGGTVVVPVQLVAHGDENMLRWSLNFENSRLTFVGAVMGAQAADGTLDLDASQAGVGRIGFVLAKPAGAMWAAGTQEVVRLTFSVGSALVPGAVSPLTFGDIPVARGTWSVAAVPLPTGFQAGTVTGIDGYEADMNASGAVTITDWVRVGRLVAGLDPMPTGSDFMKADCAPRSSQGNGTLSITDWVQAGRYAAGLDPLTPVGGPGAP